MSLSVFLGCFAAVLLLVEGQVTYFQPGQVQVVQPSGRPATATDFNPYGVNVARPAGTLPAILDPLGLTVPGSPLNINLESLFQGQQDLFQTIFNIPQIRPVEYYTVRPATVAQQTPNNLAILQNMVPRIDIPTSRASRLAVDRVRKALESNDSASRAATRHAGMQLRNQLGVVSEEAQRVLENEAVDDVVEEYGDKVSRGIEKAQEDMNQEMGKVEEEPRVMLDHMSAIVNDAVGESQKLLLEAGLPRSLVTRSVRKAAGSMAGFVKEAEKEIAKSKASTEHEYVEASAAIMKNTSEMVSTVRQNIASQLSNVQSKVNAVAQKVSQQVAFIIARANKDVVESLSTSRINPPKAFEKASENIGAALANMQLVLGAGGVDKGLIQTILLPARTEMTAVLDLGEQRITESVDNAEKVGLRFVEDEESSPKKQ